MADPLRPTGKLDVTAVAGLHADLMARQGQDVTIDMSGVSLLGALCLQTLIAGARATRQAGNSFDLINTGDLILAQMASMGMSPETISEGAYDP